MLNYKVGFFSLLALLLVGSGLLAYLFVNGQTTLGDDGREAVSLSEAEKSVIAKEMRSFLGTIMAIQDALARDQPAQVAQLARKNGMQEVELVPGPILAKLPMEFKQAGFAVHKRFDALAERAEQGGTTAELQADLAQITGSCLGCHDRFKVVTAAP